ncbi:MAG TPA: DUF1573 domain-containing protein [Thermoanaerobaculia bacterium]|jgi:hypothetical protein|nr:DUF1573 domain-containing protein [Thermoanaerobaculia bacterium]
MKRHLRTANLALCCALLVAASLFAQGAATGKPKAVAVEPIKDIGFVAKGERAAYDFTIRNEGDAPLQIQEVRAACGCTVADYDKVIAPGQTGKVRVSVDTATFSGAIAKGVTVFMNDPATPQMELTIRAQVEPFIKAKPGYARFVTVQGEAKEGTIVQTLWTPDGSPMKIVKVESPYPFLKVDFHEATPEERLDEVEQPQWKVVMHLSNDAPVGPLTESVKVYTENAKQKLVQIPVSGFVRPIVAVTPPIANFGQVTIKEPLRKSLNVKSFATEPIKLTGAQSSIPGIDARIEPVEDGREYQVWVTVSPAVKGKIDGKLFLTTDSVKIPRIEIQLSGTAI